MYYPESNLHTIEIAGIFGSDAPDARDHAEKVKRRLAEIGPELIILNHRPAPDDTPARQARAIANALTACEQIAPKATVMIVSCLDPHELAAAYRAAQKYRKARNGKAAQT